MVKNQSMPIHGDFDGYDWVNQYSSGMIPVEKGVRNKTSYAATMWMDHDGSQ